MSRMICLETDEGEVYINLDQVCQATIVPDRVRVQFSGGQSHAFGGASAHALAQALRHEERRSTRPK